MANNVREYPLYNLITKAIETGGTIACANVVGNGKRENLLIRLYSFDKDTFVSINPFTNHEVYLNGTPAEYDEDGKIIAPRKDGAVAGLSNIIESNMQYLNENYKTEPNKDLAEAIKISIDDIQDISHSLNTDNAEMKGQMKDLAKALIDDLVPVYEAVKVGNYAQASMPSADQGLSYEPTLRR